MHHGGPDDSGYYHQENVMLAHNRLSIIDLSAQSHQPMELNDLVLTYNGEIYNFKEIREELLQKGHQFYSTGDTEVIIKSFLEWGVKSFGKFNGMFAFGLLDKKNNSFYLVRDASGIKPLYYSIKNKTLIFASEIKAFYETGLFSENENWQKLLLAFGYIPAPATTLNEVNVFPKGNYLKWDIQTSSYSFHSFYQYNFRRSNISFEDAKQLVRNKLTAAVERHLISDAPIGVFLSGGIDSSLLTLIASKILKENLVTLSVYFDEKKYSEYNYQKLISDKIPGKHIAEKITKEILYKSFNNVFSAMDQPTTDGINSYFISSVAHENGLKAVLSGIGADELFGGYPSFSRMKWVKSSRLLPPSILSFATVTGNTKIKKIDYLSKKNNIGDYLFLRGFFTVSEIAHLYNSDESDIWNILFSCHEKNEINEMNSRNKATYLESNYYMYNQLLKDTDMMSMWHSLEVRVPFLDKELVELIYSIPEEIKFNSVPKNLLVESFKDILPNEIYNRKKKGFTFPFQKWLCEVSILDELKEVNSFTYKKVEQFKRNEIHWSRIWALYIANFWHEKKQNLIAN